MTASGAPADALRHAALSNVGQKTAHESVAEALRNAILSGDLAGGARLVQTDLASRLGVSITPVREAMRQLATEGLIRFDSYRGTVVLAPSLEEIREVYELLSTLNPLATRKAVHSITTEELRQARSLAQSMEETPEVGDWIRLNREFHLVLYRAARSPRLLSIISSLSDSATAQIALGLKQGARSRAESNAEHTQLLEAFEARDTELAVSVSNGHLEKTLRALESTLPDGTTDS
jgi:DNA-binding GntR family transcriptional regulator